MTQLRHTPLSLRTQLVSLAAGMSGADARDYFSNDRTSQQLGTFKSQLERDGFKDVAGQVAVALRIADLLKDGAQIGAVQALQLQRMIVESIAAALGVELPAAAEPVAAADGAPPEPPPARAQPLTMVSNRKLGEILVQMSLLTTGQVEQALAHQRMTGCRLGEALIQLRLLSKTTIESALRVQNARRNNFGDPWRAAS